MEKKFKLVKRKVSYIIALTSLVMCTGCTKEVDCNIEEEHVHLYINEDDNLSRYIQSEKVEVDNHVRKDEYLPMTDELNIINDNKFYIVEDNTEYLNKVINEKTPKREAYVYDYIYGTYVGYGMGYNVLSGKTEYFYGTHTGYHYGYEWQEISLDEYTEVQVRDITYQFRFYKINDDGTVSSLLVNSLDELPEEYKYFKSKDLIKENVGDSYYLQKEKEKTK